MFEESLYRECGMILFLSCRGAYSSAMNKVWHPEHFICHRCHSQLSGGTFIFEEDKIFCNNCYEKQVAQICSFCRKPIVGVSTNTCTSVDDYFCYFSQWLMPLTDIIISSALSAHVVAITSQMKMVLIWRMECFFVL